MSNALPGIPTKASQSGLKPMQSVPVPANETERLEALYQYGILDTPPEAAFDRITGLAARLFQTQTVLISLVDESRAWFKSSIGFDAPEVSRDATLCNFSVLTDELLVVADARLDERFACNPFVQSDSGVRFYAGAPLITRKGFNLGTLCLLDSQPRANFSAEQRATLCDLAAIVVDELELRLAARRVAHIDAALLEISQGMATVTGGEFFEALVWHFAKVLKADYVYIGLMPEDNPTGLKTIATCAHGQIVDNLEYSLQGTPCWQVIEQRKFCCFPRNVQALFPDAPLLEPLGVESYSAISFSDAEGNVLGLIGVMDSKPLENIYLTESLLRLFADRVATELARHQAEMALRQSEERFRALVSATSNGLYRITADWRAIQELKGEKFIANGAESCQAWLQKYIPIEDQARVLKAVEVAIKTKGLFELEHRVNRAQGGMGWICSRAVPLLDEEGTIVEWIGEYSDISDRKRIEAEREQLLVREQAAREQAERANRIKDEFLAVLSHELRSPLNPILGWTRLLQGGNLSDARQQEALKVIERNARLQSQLVEDLLDISRIMQGKLTLNVAAVNMAAVVSAAIETVALSAEAKKIEIISSFEAASFPFILGDATRLQQVVWNLLANAVKFTPNCGRITVELCEVNGSEGAPLANRFLQLRVSDTGKGIVPACLPHVFEYFYQEDSSITRQFGGLGLGLTIVKQIVELHGGTIAAQSEGKNCGAIFTVQLPVAQLCDYPATESVKNAPD
jgi:signal transduction histidine kinase